MRKLYKNIVDLLFFIAMGAIVGAILGYFWHFMATGGWK